MKVNLVIEFKKSLLGRYTKNLIQLMPKKVAIALILMVLISLTEGISLILLVPLLQLVGITVGQGSIGQIEGYVTSFFTSFGLQLNLFTVLILYVVIVSFGALLYRLETIRTNDIEFLFAAHLRNSLYKAITNSRWLFFSKMKSSNFAHALTNEIERISIGTGQFLSVLSSIMILVIYIIFALKIAGSIVGIIFIVGILMLLLLRKKADKSQLSGEEITSTTRDLYSNIIQHLEGMKTIKSFGMQEENITIFSKQTENVATNYIGAIKSYADVKLLFDVGTVIVLAIMVIVLIEFIKLPTASLLLLIYLFGRMIPQFSTIQHSYQYFINMLPAFENVQNLKKLCLENSEKINFKGNQIKLKQTINLENISFEYNNDEYFSIENLNLKITAGKTTAIVGSSGAGKSTLADLVMGLILPDNGDIKVDGISISDDYIGYWRSQIGYVAQETFLFNETIRFNLLLAQPKAKEKDIMVALKLTAAYEFVSKFPEGLDTVIGDRGVRLSGGERQRLALARALLRKPDLLILDEATSNLDSKNEKKILDSLENLHGKLTILVIAHRLSTIRSADIIHIMDDGLLIESGSWNQLISNKDGHFSNLIEFQGLK